MLKQHNKNKDNKMFTPHQETKDRYRKEGADSVLNEQAGISREKQMQEEAYMAGADNVMSAMSQSVGSQEPGMNSEAGLGQGVSEEATQYGSPETNQLNQIAGQIAEQAANYVIQNQVDPQNIQQVVGKLMADNIGIEKLNSNTKMANQIGSMATQLAVETIDEAIKSGTAQAPQQSQPQQQVEQGQQPMPQAGLV